MKKIHGNTIVYGDNIDTDGIIPGRYLSITDPETLAHHTMEDVDPTFLTKYISGDILVVGKNFGCGSSREQAVICLQQIGVHCIIAKSFARIFYRNGINNGMLLIESADLPDQITSGDALKINYENGTILNQTTNTSFTFQPLTGLLLSILTSGGLIPFLRNKEK